MRKSSPVKVKVYYPKAETGQQELQRRAAEAHAGFVSAYIKNMTCPTQQKLELINAIAETASTFTQE